MAKILRVDLTSKEISYEESVLEDEEKYLGGIGVATSIFTREVDPNIDPFDEKNLLIFSVGPYCGTAIPYCGRHFVLAKSPLTKILGEASSGGFFGNEMKRAGFDHIIIKGKSAEHVYLWIKDGEARILDGASLWNKGIQETHEKIKELQGDNKVRIAAIGLAGENLVKFAAIINDNHHAAGRCGMGAVMGSKNLKAIAIRGTGKVEVNDKDAVLEAAKAIRELTKEDILAMLIAESGTPVHIDSMAGYGDIIVKNYTMGRWSGLRKIGAKAMHARGEMKMHGCFNCPTACRGYLELDGEWVSRPEYETLGMLGSNLLVDDLETLIRWNLLANDLGLDTISLGAVIACFLEAIESKLIEIDISKFGFTEEQIWGAIEPIEKLIYMITSREGIGAELAEGVRTFCKTKGLPKELSMHGKGLEIPAHEPRANNLTGLDYATTPRGAYHCYEPMHVTSHMNLKEEIDLMGGINRFSKEKEVAEAVIKVQDGSEAYSACGGCIFGYWFTNKLTPWVDAINAITGRNYSIDSWMEAGNQIFNLKRNYNLKCGTTKEDDTYGVRFSIALEKGGTRKNIPPHDELLQYYYELRGWD